MALGVVNVDGMLRGLTARQFAEWGAYFSLEPFGEFREDVRNAKVVQMLYNVNADKKHQLGIEDFILTFGDVAPKKKQTWQEQLQIARLITALSGGTVL